MELKFTLETGRRLDAGIALQYPGEFSRTMVQRVIREGCVMVEQKVCLKPSYKADHPVEVFLRYEPPPEYTLEGNDEFSVPVLFQDEYLAVIHKPAGMTVHPGAGTKDDTLVHTLLAQIETLSEGSDRLRPGIVHRLDRETEGLMVIAKTNQAHFLLAEAFAARSILKQYHAWVWGTAEPSKEISGYIGRHPRERKKMLFEFSPLDDTWKTAVMRYENLGSTNYFSLIKITLGTGRTHQIRATMAKLNQPVLGDTVYSNCSRRLDKTELNAAQKQTVLNGGLYLLASRLQFTHPITQKVLDFELPLPERFHTIKLLQD